MKSSTVRYLIPIFLILAGTMMFSTWEKKSSDPVPRMAPGAPPGVPDGLLRGPNGGILLRGGKEFQIEITLYEQGVPPQFRVYAADGSSNPVDPGQVTLRIELHRLDRVDRIGFQPAGDFLLGDRVVEEPHSFDVKAEARYKGKTHSWEYSSIEGRAVLSPGIVREAGIAIESAGPATLRQSIDFPGEVTFNEERLAHIVPRLDGVVRSVHKDLGDEVREGEVLLVLESRELADAKTLYLEAVQKTSLARIDLDRQEDIAKNTDLLLNLLESGSSTEELDRKLKDRSIGEGRAKLVHAYARLRLARTVFEREENLYRKNISSQSEYLAALEDLRITEATFLALKENTAFDVHRELLERQRKFTTAELNLASANQKLRALGLGDEAIEELVQSREHAFTQYLLKSALSGTVIKKHVAQGEAVKKDDDIFVLADLSDVWINIAIPEKDLKQIRLGQAVRVKAKSLDLEARGKLTYLGNLIDETTRTVTGRVVIPNPRREWRPGLYVTVELVLGERKVPLAVRKEALQSFRGWTVVFGVFGDIFEARPLEIGDTDGTWVEVLKGISPGTRYVTQNSFAIKAEILKSGAVHDH
ncbi:MAG: hypothetical protein COV67_08345 [Nitrospinae bacterium CG11_big_fil_rev_8_21_14_0_20_56_8]|nr:MAG: hypothetical protein COV67_08345 [Nitrospinae bacterium CG11_big_fil_rev_8_21_14_0_20_56_8]